MSSDSSSCCFRGREVTASAVPDTVACFYQTPSGLVVLTWSRSFLGRSLHADLHLHDGLVSYSLQLKPWLFWRNRGSKTFVLRCQRATRLVRLSWDLTRAKFLSRPEPVSGFHLCVVLNRETILLLGDSQESKAQEQSQNKKKSSSKSRPPLVLRQDHVIGVNNFTTKARFGGKTRDISVECTNQEDRTLDFRVDGERVLEVKKLKWKFRGSEKVEVDGVRIQVSWDVHCWLFNSSSSGSDSGNAVFVFRFEEQRNGDGDGDLAGSLVDNKWSTLRWTPTSEEKKKTKSMSRKKLHARSSSSSSSVSSASSSSVTDWTSAEEAELQSLPGFTLQVYARRSN